MAAGAAGTAGTAGPAGAPDASVRMGLALMGNACINALYNNASAAANRALQTVHRRSAGDHQRLVAFLDKLAQGDSQAMTQEWEAVIDSTPAFERTYLQAVKAYGKLFARSMTVVGAKASLKYNRASAFYARFLGHVAGDSSVADGKYFSDAMTRQIVLQSNFLDSIASSVTVTIKDRDEKEETIETLTLAGPVAEQVARTIVGAPPAEAPEQPAAAPSVAPSRAPSRAGTAISGAVTSVSKAQISQLRVKREPSRPPALSIPRANVGSGGAAGGAGADFLADLPDDSGTLVGEFDAALQ